MNDWNGCLCLAVGNVAPKRLGEDVWYVKACQLAISARSVCVVGLSKAEYMQVVKYYKNKLQMLIKVFYIFQLLE